MRARSNSCGETRFLAELEAATPWAKLIAVLEPHQPKGEGRGRPPIGLARMLRMYVVQQCSGLCVERMEDGVYDSQAIRGFIGIDMTVHVAPDTTTLLKFRRLLEMHTLTQMMFNTINGHLAEKGLLLEESTVVDATIIAAPSSTKNQSGKRDADMHQKEKGKTRHFGMNAHIGVDAHSGLVHTIVTTAAKTADVTQPHALLPGEDTHAVGDAGCTGVAKRDEHPGSAMTWHVAM